MTSQLHRWMLNLHFSEPYREYSVPLPEDLRVRTEDGEDRQVLPEKVLFMELKFEE